MALQNTFSSYGSVSKTFHWLTALLILTVFPLGVIAYELPYGTSEELALKAQLFTVHKTLGVIVFFVALTRIIWSLTQIRPGLLNADNRLEAFAAEAMHSLLYLSLVLVPLSGWLHHAATEGFAPIAWPFGQGLPFVPRSETIADLFGSWHKVFTKVLLAAMALHVLGALKHAILDRDGTLARMWFGKPVASIPPKAPHSRVPAFTAICVYLAALVGASVAGYTAPDSDAAHGGLERVESEWQVQEGELAIEVVQLGSALSGSFGEWTAAISFDEAASDGAYGEVSVEIAISSLTLGSVTSEALAAEFFDAATFPTARFEATIISAGEDYIADGTLSLRGAEVPVQLPFELIIDDDTAEMTGRVDLDRRDFGIGQSYADEETVGFSVGVTVNLIAQRDES